MNICMWMVILNDEYYVEMALKSVLPYIDYVYIQDQGCTDNSIKIIKEVVGNQAKLCIEEEHHGLGRFNKDYNEPHYRSLALKRAEEVFNPVWLLQCDADDIFTPYFFNAVNHLNKIGKMGDFNCVRHASERFITPEYRSQSPHAKQVVGGINYYDPHTRLWRAGKGVKYIPNPTLKGNFHCVLDPEPHPTFWLPGICNIHLHRMFGPKAFVFWHEGEDEFEDTIPFNPKLQAPKWFNHELNMGTAVYTPYEWPDYIKEKWDAWGTYE